MNIDNIKKSIIIGKPVKRVGVQKILQARKEFLK